MITNIVASVIVVLTTNVSERLPEYASFTIPMFSAPTLKYVRTTVVEDTDLVFDYGGRRTNVLSSRVLSDAEVTMQRVESWVPIFTNDYRALSGFCTNSLVVTNMFCVTNMSGTTVYIPDYWTNMPQTKWQYLTNSAK